MNVNEKLLGDCPRGHFFPCFIALLLLGFNGNAGWATETWPAETSPIDIGSVGGGLPGSEEVSGAVWNPVTQRLFVIDDNTGRISSMDASGSNKISWAVSESDHDHEAITIADRNSHYVYVGVEQSPKGQSIRKVRQYDISGTSAVLVQSWTLTEMDTGPANSGLEGLAFVPNEFLSSFPDTTNGLYNGGQGSRFGSGGLFFASLQDNGAIYVYDLDIAHSSTNSVFVHEFTPVSGRTDLSDMDFDRSSGLLYLLWDTANLLATWTVPTLAEPNGRKQHEWDLWSGGTSRSDEGVAVVNSCAVSNTSRLFVTDDHGEFIYRFDLWPCPSEVNIAVGDAVASETNSADIATFMVSRTNDLGTQVSLAYAITGTASNGVDYVAITGSVTLTNGMTSNMITITPLPDDLAEGDETVTLTLATPSGCVVVTPTNATVIIRDKPFDAWRFMNFTAAENTNAAISGETADPDGDGMDNLHEFLAGTDPTNSASLFRVMTVQPSGPDYVVSFTSVTGKVYDVESCTDLVSAAWSVVTNNLAGNNGIVHITDPGAASVPQRFYRARLTP